MAPGLQSTILGRQQVAKTKGNFIFEMKLGLRKLVNAGGHGDGRGASMRFEPFSACSLLLQCLIECSSTAPVNTSTDAPPGIRRSSIDVLPDDLLYSIFLTYGGLAGSYQIFPTTASHVCRRWRRLVLGASMLWSSIIVTKGDTPMEKYAEWIRRSRDAPLDIELWRQAFRRDSAISITEVLRLLLPEVRRWRSLKFSNVSGSWPSQLNDQVVRQFFDQLRDILVPQLESLTIRARWGPRSLPWTFQAFQQGTPRLRRVDLAFSSVPWSSPLLRNLHTLQLGAPEELSVESQAHHLLDILLHSPKLQSLTVYPSGDSTLPSTLVVLAPPSHDFQSISHLYLTYLSITPTLLHVMRPFLDQLPALKTFRLACYMDASGPASPIDRIAPGLERLIIDGYGSVQPFFPEVHLPTFAKSTSITSIEFVNNRFIHQGWEMSATLFPPNVQFLAIVNSDWYKTAHLKKFVTDRIGVRPLRKLVLEHYAPWSLDDDGFEAFLEAHGVEGVFSKPWTIDKYEYIWN